MALISPDPTALPPDRLGVAYKEWAGVCRALGSGRQSILLRKGGIAEGPEGFVPEYASFWLYPTYLHQAQQALREPVADAPLQPRDGFVELALVAVVESIRRIVHEEDLGRLDEFHVWTEETVRSRFRYRSPGLWLLGVRIYQQTPACSLLVTPEHAGCKTWVNLDEALSADRARPVLSDEAASRRREALTVALRSSHRLST